MSEILLISTSKTHGTGYLEHCKEQICEILKGKKKIAFVPYARPSGISHNDYTEKVSETMGAWGFEVSGVHEKDNPSEIINESEAIFIGGGNTFLLLKTLYEKDLIKNIQEKVSNNTPYIGTSAGSNVAGLTINTTNDMPVVYPPSFEALKLVPFIINPHYLDTDPNSTHMGESRDTRIQEYLELNEAPHDVIGLKEGSMLRISGKNVHVLGENGAKIFKKGENIVEKNPGDKIYF